LDNRAVGVFDSGLGGLTAVRELKRILPNEKIIFLGDTLRVPYGSRDRETLLSFAEDDLRFLTGKNVKYIIIACGTVSSNISAELISSVPVPVTGVILPTVAAAAASTRCGRIGIIATEACVRSGAYQRGLLDSDPSFEITAVPCPRLVPLIESAQPGMLSGDLRQAAEEYLLPIKEAGADTLILGCTHYPLISDLISGIMGPDVTLIDSGAQAAAAAKAAMESSGTLSGLVTCPEHEFYVTSDPGRFIASSKHFLGEGVETASLVSLKD